MSEMDVYECIKPVNYGRIDYTPDSDIEKSRIIKLPKGTPVDKTISTYFRKKGVRVPVEVEPEEATVMAKDEVVASLLEPEEVPKVPEVDTEESLHKKFEDNDLYYDGRWNIDTLKTKFEEAMKEKEESDNE